MSCHRHYSQLSFLSLLMGLFLAQLFFHVDGVSAQFGIPKKTTAEATVDANGDVQHQLPKEVLVIATSLVTIDPSLKVQDAVDMAALLDAAKKDPDTQKMLQKMKADQPDAFTGTAASPPLEIIKGLQQAFEELNMLDYLFQDKDRALREMEKEGMVPKEKMALYQQNPDLLEADTRKGLYFTFVALAEAAGYMA